MAICFVFFALGLSSAIGQVVPATGGVQAEPSATVVDVKVSGNRSVPLSRILPHIKTRRGRPFDLEQIQEDVRRLDRTGLFVTVKTVYQQVPGGRVVYFEVIERPLLTEVLFVGCKKISKKTLQKEAQLKAGDPADTMAIEEARRKLEQYYHEHGYNSAHISLLEGDQPEDRRAIFSINEGTKQLVFNTKFIGNTIASDSRLQTLIQSKHPFLWIPFFGGDFDRKQLDEDVQRLTAYYRGLGFFRARIGRKLEFNKKQDWVTVTFVIDEGPRYKIRNVSVVGNTKYSEEELLSNLQLKSGEYFNQSEMTADRNGMVDKYGGIGYVFADIKPDPRFLEEPGQLDLVYNIQEGDRYTVGKINVVITGEYPHTRLTTILNRLSFRPGDIVDIRKIRSSEAAIKRSQLFETNPANGSAPKIVFNPPGQGAHGKEAVAKRPKNKPDPNGHRGGPLFRGQSPDALPRDRKLDITLDCGRYVGPPEEYQGTEVRGQETEVRGQGSGARGPWAGHVVAQEDALEQSANALASVLANKKAKRTRLILTQQYSPNAGRTNPATSPSTQWTSQTSQPDTSASTATQPAPVQPAPAYGQQMWPTLTPQPPIDTPDGLYSPGPILNSNSPFLGGPPDGGEPLTPLTFDVFAQEAMTGRFMVGMSVNSDAGLVGSVVWDEQNFDWRRFPRSWEEIRNGTALRGDGQRFRVEAAPSITTTSGTQPLQRYMVTFQEPYLFDTPISMSLNGYYYNRMFTEYTDTRVGGRVGLGYQFTPDLSASIAYRGARVAISDPIDPLLPDFTILVGRNLALHGFQLTAAYDKRDNAFMATEGYLLEASVEEVLGTFQYPRGQIDLRKYFKVHERPDGSGRHVVSLAVTAAVTGDDTPIYDRYYAGGFSSLRGFQFRGVSPTVYDPVNGITTYVGGNFELLASVEYLIPLTADDMIRAAVFCDTGTIEPTIDDWSNEYRVAPGFGLRLTVPAMGPAPIALDFAFPVCWQPGDRHEMFSFFVGFGR